MITILLLFFLVSFSYTADQISSRSSGLVGLWHMNENSGTTTKDATQNGNNGTITGATWVTGEFGRALSFDGNDYVTIPTFFTITNYPIITISVWYYPTNSKENCVLVSQNAANGMYQTRLTIYHDGRVNGGLLVAAVKWLVNISFYPASYRYNEWHHAAFVSNGINISIY